MTLCQKLQKLQNRAARIITKSDNDSRSTDILRDLGWENLESRRYDLKKRSVIRVMKEEAPQHMTSLLKPKHRRSSVILRNSDNKLDVKKSRTDCYKGSFSYSGAVLWNSLPAETRVSIPKSLNVTQESCS